MDATAIQILDTEATTLKGAKADALALIERTKARLDEIEIELRTVEKIRQQFAKSIPKTDDAETEGPGATEAILAYIRANPNKRGPQIVQAASELGIRTQATNFDRLIYNTIHTLQKKGKIVRADDGSLRAVEEYEMNGRVEPVTNH